MTEGGRGFLLNTKLHLIKRNYINHKKIGCILLHPINFNERLTQCLNYVNQQLYQL